MCKLFARSVLLLVCGLFATYLLAVEPDKSSESPQGELKPVAGDKQPEKLPPPVEPTKEQPQASESAKPAVEQDKPVVVAITSYKKYDHDQHDKVMIAEKLDCNYCHTKPNDKSLGKQGVDSCHNCHKNQKWQTTAGQDCTVCHSKVPLPADHLPERWNRESHGLSAKFHPKSCDNCHKSSECIQCHNSKETIKRDVHNGNFILTHSVAARVDANSCSRCHQVSYCTDCHARRTK